MVKMVKVDISSHRDPCKCNNRLVVAAGGGLKKVEGLPLTRVTRSSGVKGRGVRDHWW